MGFAFSEFYTSLWSFAVLGPVSGLVQMAYSQRHQRYYKINFINSMFNDFSFTYWVFIIVRD